MIIIMIIIMILLIIGGLRADQGLQPAQPGLGEVRDAHPGHVYVCMYACMHVCMYACMYACMHVCMYACTHVCMYACMHVCMYVSFGLVPRPMHD